jgi:hypothetical protein
MSHSLADVVAAVPYITIAVAKFCSLFCGSSVVKPLLYVLPKAVPSVPFPVESIYRHIWQLTYAGALIIVIIGVDC